MAVSGPSYAAMPAISGQCPATSSVEHTPRPSRALFFINLLFWSLSCPGGPRKPLTKTRGGFAPYLSEVLSWPPAQLRSQKLREHAQLGAKLLAEAVSWLINTARGVMSSTASSGSSSSSSSSNTTSTTSDEDRRANREGVPWKTIREIGTARP